MTLRALAAVAAVLVHAATVAGAVSQSAATPAIVSRIREQVGCIVPAQALRGVKMWVHWYATGGDWLIEPTPVKSTEVPTGPAIDVGFGDAGNLLLCFGKQWVMGGHH